MILPWEELIGISEGAKIIITLTSNVLQNND